MARVQYFGRHRFGAAGLVWCMAGGPAARKSIRPGFLRRLMHPATRPAARVVVLPLGDRGAHRNPGMSRAA